MAQPADAALLAAYTIMIAAVSKATATNTTEANNLTPAFINNIPWPTGHSWDKAFFVIIAILETSRLLMPIAAICCSIAVTGLVLVLTTVAEWRNSRVFGLLYVPICIFAIPIAYVVLLALKRREHRKVLLRLLGVDSDYVGLFTHGFKLPGLLSRADSPFQFADHGNGASRPSKFQILFALMSWQEMLGCVGVVAWAVIAFTPETYVPGSSWPFVAVVHWLMMQAAFAWRTRGATALSMGIAVVAVFCAFFYFIGWWQRRRDLCAVAKLRGDSQHAVLDVVAVMQHLAPEGSDSAQTATEKMERVSRIWVGALQPPTIWERLRFPKPSSADCLYAASFMYGAFVSGIFEFLVEGGTPLYQFFQKQQALGAEWARRAFCLHPLAWLQVALLLFLVWLVVSLVTWRAQSAWMSKCNAVCWTLSLQYGRRADARLAREASAIMMRDYGNYPDLRSRFFTCVGVLWRLVIGASCGAVLLRMITHTTYLPGYAFPAYDGGPYTRFYCSGPCPVGQRTSDPAMEAFLRGCSVTNCAGTGSGVAGWWLGVQAAARVNILAARAWRLGGLDAVQVAMEALRAAVSPRALADTELEQRAIRTLRRLQETGLADVRWRIGGEWAMQEVWESRESRVVGSGKWEGGQEERDVADGVGAGGSGGSVRRGGEGAGKKVYRGGDEAQKRSGKAVGEAMSGESVVKESDSGGCEVGHDSYWRGSLFGGVGKGSGDACDVGREGFADSTNIPNAAGSSAGSKAAAGSSSQTAKSSTSSRSAASSGNGAGSSSSASSKASGNVKAGGGKQKVKRKRSWTEGMSQEEIFEVYLPILRAAVVMGLIMLVSYVGPKESLSAVGCGIVWLFTPSKPTPAASRRAAEPYAPASTSSSKASKRAARQQEGPQQHRQQQQGQQQPSTGADNVAQAQRPPMFLTRAISPVLSACSAVLRACLWMLPSRSSKDDATDAPTSDKPSKQTKQQQSTTPAAVASISENPSAATDATAATTNAPASASAASSSAGKASTSKGPSAQRQGQKQRPAKDAAPKRAPASQPAKQQPAKAAPATRRGGNTVFVRPDSVLSPAATTAAAPSSQAALDANSPRSAAAAAVAAALPFTAALARSTSADLRQQQQAAAAVSPPPAGPTSNSDIAASSAPATASSMLRWAFPAPPRAASPNPPAADPTDNATATAAAAPSGVAAARSSAPRSSTTPQVPAKRSVPIPIPVPVTDNDPTTPPLVPPSTGGVGHSSAPRLPLLGLNPALAHFLKQTGAVGAAAPAAQPPPQAAATAAVPPATAQPGSATAHASAAATANAAPAPPPPTTAASSTASAASGAPKVVPGGLWGDVAGRDPTKCVACREQPRQVGFLHGINVHLCVCRTCAAGFQAGDACPLCGEVSQRVLNIF